LPGGSENKKKIHEKDLQTARRGGETLVKTLLVAPIDFIDTISFNTMIKRE
jgi:hypothetical protein